MPYQPELTGLPYAMQLNPDTGLPEIRVSIGSGIDITGTVNIPGTVTVSSTPADPIHTHITEVGTSGILTTAYMPVGGTVTVQDGGGSLTVDGSVNIGTMPEVEIKNDSGNPISVSKNNSTNSESNPIFVKGTSDTSFFSPMQSDAFGRLRVSNPETLYDSFNTYQDNDSLTVYTAGGGSSAHDANGSTVLMSVGTANGDEVVRETSKVFAYQPGKSLQILQTFCLSPSQTNLRQRIGYFDTSNGFYLQLNNSTLSFVRRSKSTGAVTELTVNQANWNVDTLLGSGPSGKTLQKDKAQIMFIDIEWLGVGSVRMGFVIDGVYCLAHVWNHANHTADSINYLNTTTTYMGTACLPLRSEITNTGVTTASSGLRVICATVISEGGYVIKGRARTGGHDIASPYSLTSSNTFYPVLSIRLKSTRLGAIVLPREFSLGLGANTTFQYKIYARAITTNGTWTDPGSDSMVEYKTNGLAISSGTLVRQGYIVSSNQSSGGISLGDVGFLFQLERNTFTGTAYEFVIAVATTSNTSPSVWASIGWEEIT